MHGNTFIQSRDAYDVCVCVHGMAGYLCCYILVYQQYSATAVNQIQIEEELDVFDWPCLYISICS